MTTRSAPQMPVDGLLFRRQWVLTLEELVPIRGAVDLADTGELWTPTVVPDETGTTHTAAFRWSSTVRFMGELMDRLHGDGDRDLGLTLAKLKKGVES